MSYNRTALMGNLTRDPELRHLPNGNAVANGSIAVNRKWKDEQGEEREEVSFFDVVAFGKTAEMLTKYLRKGDPVLVDGRLKQDRWEDKASGQQRSRVVVQVERLHFIGGKRRGDGTEQAAAPRTANKAAATGAQSSPGDDGDDIPF